MMEERARVVEVGDGFAWVETQRQLTCGACNVSKVCGTANLAKAMGGGPNRLRILTSVPLQVGNEVIIGIREDVLVKVSLAVYMVPLLLMFNGALFGEFVVGAGGEVMTVLFAAVGLLSGFLWLGYSTRGIRATDRIQPVVIRRL